MCISGVVEKCKYIGSWGWSVFGIFEEEKGSFEPWLIQFKQERNDRHEAGVYFTNA